MPEASAPDRAELGRCATFKLCKGPRSATTIIGWAESQVLVVQEGAHLEARVQPQQPADLRFSQRAGAIRLNSDGLE